MDRTFSKTPRPYGPVHILILLGIAALLVLFWFASKRAREKTLLRVLLVCGLFMIAAEACKQWFVIRYVYAGVKSAWFFPWQLCSIAMYASALAPFLKGKAQEAALVFLSTFSVIGAVFALALPEDMMRPQILLFIHSFLYHAMMLIEAIAALRVLLIRKKASFPPALVLFLIAAAIAEGINVVSHLLIHDVRHEANMFYITPFYPSTQPVFCQIAAHTGIFVEIVVYLGAIALAAFLLYLIEFARIRRETN